jgi:hypothetical protein
MQYQIPHVTPPQQGPTIQPWFIYPVNQPNYALWKRVVGNRTSVTLQGATNQQTYVFVPNQPQNYADVRQQPNIRPPILGVTVTATQTYLFPVSQPTTIPYPQQPEIPKRTEGATKQQQYIFPVSQPEYSYYKPDINRFIWEGPDQMFDGAIKQQTYLFPPNQPDQARYNFPDLNRYPQEGQQPQIHQGATKQATSPIPPVSQPQNYADQRQQPAPKLSILGVTVTTAQTYVFSPNQPEFSYYKPDINRFQDELVKRTEGATNQSTFPIPQTNQPQNYADNRQQPVQPVQVLGTTVIIGQSFVFPVNQPEARYYFPDTNRYTDPVTKRFEGTTPLISQSYIFPVNQPNYAAYKGVYGTRIAIPLDGSSNQQTYVFLPSQPNFQYYVYNTPASPTNPILGVIVAPTILNYYTGAFSNEKRMRRGMGF